MAKRYSEADAGSMAGYDPNLGLGKKGYAKATAVPKPKLLSPAALKKPMAGAQGNSDSTTQRYKGK